MSINILHKRDDNDDDDDNKPERWGSPLVQEKYQAEKACDKRHPY